MQEHVWLFEWHLEDGIYWEKSPKLLQERNREDGIYLDLENSPILLRELVSIISLLCLLRLYDCYCL